MERKAIPSFDAMTLNGFMALIPLSSRRKATEREVRNRLKEILNHVRWYQGQEVAKRPRGKVRRELQALVESCRGVMKALSGLGPEARSLLRSIGGPNAEGIKECCKQTLLLHGYAQAAVDRLEGKNDQAVVERMRKISKGLPLARIEVPKGASVPPLAGKGPAPKTAAYLLVWQLAAFWEETTRKRAQMRNPTHDPGPFEQFASAVLAACELSETPARTIREGLRAYQHSKNGPGVACTSKE